jgi:subtilisin
MELEDQIDAMGYADAIVVLKPIKKRRGADGKMALDLGGTVDAQQEAADKVEKLLSRSPDPRISAIQSEVRYQGRHNMETMVLTRSSARRAPGSPLYLPYLGIVIGTVDKRAHNELKKLRGKEVRAILAAPELSLIRPTVALGTEIPEGLAWGLRMLEVEKLWQMGLTGADVLVGHIDTGVDNSHPMLATAVDTFAQFDLLGDMAIGALASDSGTHGTHTASVIAGRESGGRCFGVAPEAKLASAMVIEGGKVTARVLAGVNWALGQGVKVLSVSLGLRGYQPLLEQIIFSVRERGVLPVVAIGNEGAGTSRTPGNVEGSLSVGAVDEQRVIWADSGSQELKGPRIKPDVIAPGVNIPCAAPNLGLVTATGTSLATPHVAGLAALLWQAQPAATVDQIERSIYESSKRPLGVSSIRGNRGIPNAPLALAKLAKILET